MDITIVFRACIKTVRTMNKTLEGKEKESKSTLLQNSRDPNLKSPKEIIKQICQLQKFFADNKIAYLNVVNYLSTKKTMTEMDRMEIDTEAEKIISLCTTMIHEYRSTIGKQKLTPQAYEHYDNVIKSVEKYLKNVSKVYTETKAIRVKKVIEMHKISKLETTNKNAVERESPKLKMPNTPAQEHSKEIVSDLSAEEMQMFETENDMLYNELNSLSREVKEMESKVVHIAELQDQFTHNVLEQEKNIDRIANIVQATTDDMRDANEQIRQAIQRNAGLRVWVLFFLLVMSFSLIFLDWYND